MKTRCDRCGGKKPDIAQVDVAGCYLGCEVASDFTLMRIGELCNGCRKNLIDTIRKWSRNGTKYNRPGIERTV